MKFVMLVEIPDPEVILGMVAAFFGGLGALYFFYKVRPHIKSKAEMVDTSVVERLEYYERQLIDIKIRQDALEMQGIEQKSEDPNLELRQFLERLAKSEVPEVRAKEHKQSEIVPERPASSQPEPNTDHNNPTDHVLQLITDRAMTSRDIQMTLKRSREHISRLMKKLFEEGFVERNTEAKPYTYSITEKGRAKIEKVGPGLATA